MSLASNKRAPQVKVNRALMLLVGLCLIAISCFEILSINQPATVQVGEEFTVTVEAKLTGKDGSTFIFGFLAPRSWKPADFTTVSFESTIGGSTMSLIDPEELEGDNMEPWEDALNRRVGIGGNYGEMKWTVFKADNALDPSGVSEDDPATGTITIKTKAGESNLIAQLGYFMGESDWGFLNDNSNSAFSFVEECIEVQGANGQAQNLCGPAPRQLIALPTFNFNDVLTITFDAKEDSTALVGAQQVYACFTAVLVEGSSSICDNSAKTQMRLISPDVWQMTLWPPSFFGLDQDQLISEILVQFRNEAGDLIVQDPAGNDFQILEKCF